MSRGRSYEELRKRCDESFAAHELRVLGENFEVQAYRLQRSGSTVRLVDVVCTRVGVVLAGDLDLGGTGAVVAHGYDLLWFTSDLEPDYLASKFLHTQWTAEAVERHIRGNIEHLREQVTYAYEADDGRHTPRDEVLARCARLERMVDAEEGLGSPQEYDSVWSSEWEEDDGDHEWVYPCYDYDPLELATLAAVHARFRALWLQMTSAGEAS